MTARLAVAIRALLPVLAALADVAENGPPAAADVLLPLAECGLELATAKHLVRSGRLPSLKEGRRIYVRRSDVLALVATTQPATAAPSHDPHVEYLRLVAAAGEKRGHR